MPIDFCIFFFVTILMDVVCVIVQRQFTFGAYSQGKFFLLRLVIIFKNLDIFFYCFSYKRLFLRSFLKLQLFILNFDFSNSKGRKIYIREVLEIWFETQMDWQVALIFVWRKHGAFKKKLLKFDNSLKKER